MERCLHYHSLLLTINFTWMFTVQMTELIIRCTDVLQRPTSVNDAKISSAVSISQHHAWRQRARERIPVRQRAIARSHLLWRWPRDRWRHSHAHQPVETTRVLVTSRHRYAPEHTYASEFVEIPTFRCMKLLKLRLLLSKSKTRYIIQPEQRIHSAHPTR